MLVQNPPLESRVPRIWTISATCAAVILAAAVAMLSFSPKATAQGEPTAKSELNEPNREETKSFKTEISSGISIELLGVSENPSKDKPWWRPDGSPLARRPYEKLEGELGNMMEKHIAREIAIRVSPAIPNNIGWTWKFDPDCTAGCRATIPSNNSESAAIYGYDMRVPADRKTVTFRFGIADGPWEVLGETSGQGGQSSRSSEGKEVVFFSAYEKDEDVILPIAHNITGLDLRVIAIGKSGREYHSEMMQLGGGKINQISAMFSKRSLKNIESFRLQGRPYKWVEFHNISLEQGQKTDVQMVLPKTPAASDVPSAIQLMTE
jgi:hypothetical protein